MKILSNLLNNCRESDRQIGQKIGLSGLKYFLLKVDPKKKISFNPKETIDLAGHTGPFIQYTFVRIVSLLNKLEDLKKQKVSSLDFQLNYNSL